MLGRNDILFIKIEILNKGSFVFSILNLKIMYFIKIINKKKRIGKIKVSLCIRLLNKELVRIISVPKTRIMQVIMFAKSIVRINLEILILSNLIVISSKKLMKETKIIRYMTIKNKA